MEGAPPAYGETDDEISRQALLKSLELGVNFFDTSGIYGLGRSEHLLGDNLSPQALVASKAGYLNAEGQQDFAPRSLRAQLEASLTRLRRSRLDLFQLHDPPCESLDDGLFKALDLWRQEGLFRALGISLRRPLDALKVVGRWGLDAVQLNLSLVDQRAVHEGVLEHCARHGVSVIARTPLCFGFLAAPVESFKEGDHRQRWGEAQRQCWNQAPSLFRQSLPDYAGSDVQLALAYCLAYPEVSVVIPGMLNPAEVEENCGALDLPPLTPEQRRALETVYRQHDFVRR